MMMLFPLTLIISSFFTLDGVKDVYFKTNTVKNLCTELSLDTKNIDYSSSGRVIMGEKFGIPWYIDIDSTGFISNIGFKILEDDFRSEIPGEIADFIERYFLELSFYKKTLIHKKLDNDRVAFLNGSVPDLQKLITSSTFSLNYSGDSYSAEWDKGNENHTIMFFPASFELILGASQYEIEKTVQQSLSRECVGTGIQSPIESGIVDTGKGILVTSPVEYYYIDSVSDMRYFLAGNDTTCIKPLYDKKYPAESLSNVFLLDGFNNIDIRITQSLYGFKTVSYTVKLGQWKNFCANNHLKSFIGIESVDNSNGEVKILLIARNESVGYNHMLSITVPVGILDDDSIPVEAILNSYIPTHNIKNLLGDA